MKTHFYLFLSYIPITAGILLLFPGCAYSKQEFGQSFVIELDKTVVIGTFTIRLKNVISEWSVDIDGNYEDGFNTYKFLISDGWRKKKITYKTQSMYHEYVTSFKWRKYTIEIVETTGDSGLKLVVWKNK